MSLYPSEDFVFQTIPYVVLSISAILIPTLMLVTAPYGRYQSSKFGCVVPAKWSWVLMESPSFYICLLFFFGFGDATKRGNLPSIIIMSTFLCHYFYRSFIYPFLLRTKNGFPFSTFVLAWIWCAFNGYIQGRWFGHYGPQYDWNYLMRWNFLVGFSAWLLGFLINIHSDYILRNLRKSGESDYKIPEGGLFNYVSGSNYLGEIIEWSGFALAAWSFPALSFAVFTASNIGPRALEHHRWYLSKFPSYPKNRKALIPFIL